MKRASNRRGKIFIAALALMLCIISIFTLVACNPDSDPVVVYIFGDYEGAEPSVTRPIINGTIVEPETPVRDGYEFLYWAVLGQEDVPFDFSGKHDSVTLVAVWKPLEAGFVELHWQSKEECGAEFVFSGARPNRVERGTTVVFEVKASPFYTGTPVVYAGATALEKGADGKYSFVADAEFTVSVSGLTPDKTPMEGYGTEARPYIVTRPVHVQDIAKKVNDRSDTEYNEAYFELGADIDFDGETLMPIGNDLLYATMFSGSFDGKGHTLRNFELESGQTASALFGYTYLATIKNLNVVADLDIISPEEGLFAAGIAAYSFGSDITGCSFEGSINVSCDTNTNQTSVYAAGIVGFMQGEVGSTSDDSATATVSYSFVRANISSYGIYDATAIGGIVGGMSGNGILATVNVYNCFADAELEGIAMRAGGIAGWMRSLASIDNCYTKGIVSTTSKKSQGSQKGGIVGEAYNENSLTYCLSGVSGVSGNVSDRGYGIIGLIAAPDYVNIDDRETALIGNVYSLKDSVTKGQRTYSLGNFDDVLALMDWNSEEWKSIDGSILPDAKGSESVPLKATFVFKETYNEHDRATLTEMADNETVYGYIPISYVFSGDGLNTLTADNGTISYGFFLDEECTQRISSAFLLSGHDITVYVGFADYSTVAGEYFIRIGNNDVKLAFDNNGMMTMSTGGIRANYMYVYNGSYIVVHDAYFAYLGFEIKQGADAHVDFRIDKNSNGTLTIYDTVFFGEGCQKDAIVASEYNKLIGKWYTMGQTLVYTFYADGSGVLSNGNAFTYIVNGNSITITQGSTRISGMLSDDGRTISLSGGSTLSIDKYDEYSGTWESAFNNQLVISFDGVNTAKVGNRTYTYSIDDNGILISQELRAYFNDNKMLVLELDGVTTVLGREGSFIGEWKDSMLDYTMTLLGIDKDGYGVGYDSNGFTFTYSYNSSMESVPINMYVRETYFGYGTLSVAKKPSQEEIDKGKPDLSGMEFLAMAVYTPSSGMITDDYNLTYRDIFYGKWNSPLGLSLDFNGDGAYHFSVPLNSGEFWTTEGKVTVTENGMDTVVDYNYDRKTATATFTYNEKVYTVTKNGEDIRATVSDGSVLDFRTPDIMSYNDWHAVGIKRISFNGQGNVDNGKVVMTFADGTKETYSYAFTNEDTTVEILNASSEVVYTLDVESLELSKADGTAVGVLGIYSDIVGKVYTVYGTGATLDLTGLLDKDGAGAATLNDISLNLRYIDGMLMMFDSSGTFVRYLVYHDENTILVADTSGKLNTIAFIRDEVMGTYYNSDASTMLVFDGAAFNGYMDAEAVLCEVDGEGFVLAETEYVYVYLDGEYVLGEMQKAADSDEIVFKPIYKVSFTAVADATKFTSEDGVKSIWLVPVEE